MSGRHVKHIPTGIVLDISRPDLGHSRGLEIKAAEYGQQHRNDPHLLCQQSDCLNSEATDDELAVFLSTTKDGVLYMRHFNGGVAHGAPKSEMHVRIAKQWTGIGEKVGYPCEYEPTQFLPTLQPDVTIKGPAAHIGVEVQLSGIATSEVLSRSDKARNFGLVPAWHSTNGTPPGWAFKTPTVMSNRLADWMQLGDQTVTSVARLDWKHCRPDNFQRCPETRRKHCGLLHPRRELVGGLRLFDVAEQLPAGALVAIPFRRNEWQVVWAADADRFRDYRAQVQEQQETKQRARAERKEQAAKHRLAREAEQRRREEERQRRLDEVEQARKAYEEQQRVNAERQRIAEEQRQRDLEEARQRWEADRAARDTEEKRREAERRQQLEKARAIAAEQERQRAERLEESWSRVGQGNRWAGWCPAHSGINWSPERCGIPTCPGNRPCATSPPDKKGLG